MKSDYQSVSVTEIEFDANNPRIKKALEKYGDEITAERIHFALRSASDEKNAAATFTRLKDSILTNGGVTQPITVVLSEKKKTCIDGNTRLAIYQELLKAEAAGDWDTIPALVMHDASQKDIETIRASAHLVGPRPWPAYEKARYLHYLRHTKFMGYDEMVALCGGNRQEIDRQIEAYDDMNTYYRDVVDDTAFHIDRFSGFVELQKGKVKRAILDAGFKFEDFGKWIMNGNIFRLEHVRKLPRVLQDKEAKDIFAKEGGVRSIERAIKHIDRKNDAALSKAGKSLTLKDAPSHILAKTLVERIDDMPFSEVQGLQKGASTEDVEAVQIYEDLADRLSVLLESVGKQ
ncbi:MAG: hypothetical protein MPK75_03885 [Alphaproteobacteria bacterium]|nr:hypothetical protein [Alphaproteobacteria bacterium]